MGQRSHGAAFFLLALVAGALWPGFAGEVSAAPREEVRYLDSMALAGRWTTGEITVKSSKDLLANNRPTLYATFTADLTKPENLPIGYPRMYLQLESEEKGWEKYDRFEFDLYGRSSLPRPGGIPAVFTVMCPDKKTGASLTIRIAKPNEWMTVSIPISSIGNLSRLGSLNFYCGEKHFKTGEKVEFFLGNFRLVRSVGGAPLKTDQRVRIITQDPFLLDGFESLDGWDVLKSAKIKKAGSAVKGAGAMQIQFPGRLRKELRSRSATETAAWDACGGVSFWIKGDGSDVFGSLSIAGWSGRMSYIYYFPLKNTEWHKVTAPWEAFAPQGQFKPIGTPGGLPPSGIDTLELGNRWTWYHNNAPIPPFSYGIDHIMVEKDVPKLAPPPRLRPLSDVLQKIKDRKPVHIVCMGDSITAGAALSDPNRQRYAVRLQAILRKRLGYDGVIVESRGVGGARLTDARAWIDRDFTGSAPDLVTVLYGYNDKKNQWAGYIKESLADYVDRIARKTQGKTAVLLLTTMPGTGAAYVIMDDVAEAVRAVAAERHLACLDMNQVFKKAGRPADVAKKYFADMAHPNPAGQELIARSIADYLMRAANEK